MFRVIADSDAGPWHFRSRLPGFADVLDSLSQKFDHLAATREDRLRNLTSIHQFEKDDLTPRSVNNDGPRTIQDQGREGEIPEIHGRIEKQALHSTLGDKAQLIDRRTQTIDAAGKIDPESAMMIRRAEDEGIRFHLGGKCRSEGFIVAVRGAFLVAPE
jgi:hypothetical protein